MKRASFSCCNFLCVVLAAAYLKYRRCRLSCLPFAWHFFSLWHTHTHTHTHTNFSFSSVRMAVINWWSGPLVLVVIFFALCMLLLTWNISGIICRACHSSGTLFHCDTHTHTHTHTRTHTHTQSLVQWNSISDITGCMTFRCIQHSQKCYDTYTNAF